MALFKRDETSAAVAGGLETVLGTSTSFQGVLKSDGNIRVDGRVQGRIETAGNLVIGPSSRVVADIRANAVQVWGQIQGNIQTSGRLEILSSGRVFGEVTVGSLMIDEGGLFRGQCFMDGQDVDELLISDGLPLLAAGDSDGSEKSVAESEDESRESDPAGQALPETDTSTDENG
ncbi:MAG: polymer-forming cytoskeletal protein [Anaerolineae bacterium]